MLCRFRRTKGQWIGTASSSYTRMYRVEPGQVHCPFKSTISDDRFSTYSVGLTEREHFQYNKFWLQLFYKCTSFYHEFTSNQVSIYKSQINKQNRGLAYMIINYQRYKTAAPPCLSYSKMLINNTYQLLLKDSLPPASCFLLTKTWEQLVLSSSCMKGLSSIAFPDTEWCLFQAINKYFLL